MAIDYRAYFDGHELSEQETEFLRDFYFQLEDMNVLLRGITELKADAAEESGKEEDRRIADRAQAMYDMYRQNGVQNLGSVMAAEDISDEDKDEAVRTADLVVRLAEELGAKPLQDKYKDFLGTWFVAVTPPELADKLDADTPASRAYYDRWFNLDLSGYQACKQIQPPGYWRFFDGSPLTKDDLQFVAGLYKALEDEEPRLRAAVVKAHMRAEQTGSEADEYEASMADIMMRHYLKGGVKNLGSVMASDISEEHKNDAVVNAGFVRDMALELGVDDFLGQYDELLGTWVLSVSAQDTTTDRLSDEALTRATERDERDYSQI